MMRDSGETVTEATRAPPPFKLEREVTLMPKEFRERMSARHKSRKSSAARSEIRGYSSKPPTARFKYSTENSYLSNYTQDSDGSHGTYTESQFKKTVKVPREHDEDMPNDDNYLNDDNNNNNQGELKSTSSHIALTGDVKFMLDNAYANYESEGGFSVRTPPQNLQIKDLMAPLDEWNNKETIQEKKYAVLPSIKHTNTSNTTSSEESETYSQRNSSGFSINNQLDFFRDKIEEDADFFADFRVNTSKVKVTPRHDPLPPIKHGTKDTNTSNTIPKKKSNRKDKNLHIL